MSLRKAYLPVRMNVPLQTKEDEKLIGGQGLLALENAVLTEGGTGAKRNGHAVVGSLIAGGLTSVPTGRKLSVRGSELLRFGDSLGYSYLDDTDEWTSAGSVESVAMSHKSVVKTTGKQLRPDMATANGISVYAWDESGGGLYYAVTNASTDRLIVAPTLLDASATHHRAYSIGNAIHIVWLLATGTIKLASINTLAPSSGAGSATTVVTDVDTNSDSFGLDSNGSSVVFAYWQTASGGIRLGYITEEGEVAAPRHGFPDVITHATASQTSIVGPDVSIDTNGSSDVCIAYATSGTVYYAVYDSSSVASLAETSVAGTGTPDRLTCCYQSDATSGGNRRCWIFLQTSDSPQTLEAISADDDGTSSVQSTQVGSKIVSKPWADGSYVYLATVHESTLWTTYFVQRNDFLIVARALSGNASSAPSVAMFPTVTSSGRSYTLALGYRTRVDSDDEDTVAVFTEDGIRQIALDFDADDSHRSAEISGTLFVAGGGFLWEYDGQGFVEAGFFYAPDDVTAPTPSNAAGSMASNGVYSYVYAYGWKNAQGDICWGPTSKPVSVTLGASDNTTTVSIPTLRHTVKTSPRSECFIGVFRTEDAGTLYYLVSNPDPTVTGTNGYVANDTAVATVSFVDKMSDANLLTKEPLYTTGGVLSNDGWESGQVLAEGKFRVFSVDAGNGDLVRYSQQSRFGYSLEQPALLSVRIPSSGGDIKAIAEMDDSIIVFRERAIYHFSGPGPLANPDAGGGFTEPQLLTSDVGCCDQRSVVVAPTGIAFQSEKGIYLLGRDRAVTYIGAPVEDYNGQTITSATLIPDKTQIVFLTDSGRTLLWDYFYNMWSTWTEHEGLSAVIAAGDYYYLRADGDKIYKRDSSYSDGNKRITLGQETSWLHMTPQLGGFQRVWHLVITGDYRSAHTLKVYYQTDYELGWQRAIELDTSDYYTESVYGNGVYGDGTYGGGSVTAYRFRIHLGAKCAAIRFRFEDSEAGPTYGASYELTELLLTVGVKPSEGKVQAERMG